MIRIKELRQKRNMTQKELADKVGLTVTMICRYETGVLLPPTKRLDAIAKALGVQTSDLFVENDEVGRPPKMLFPMNDGLAFFLFLHNVEIEIRPCTNGCCEFCRQPAPFVYNDTPYLLLTPLKKELDPDEGFFLAVIDATQWKVDDYIDSYALLCPNCSERIRKLRDKNDLKYMQYVVSHRKKKIDE